VQPAPNVGDGGCRSVASVLRKSSLILIHWEILELFKLRIKSRRSHTEEWEIIQCFAGMIVAAEQAKGECPRSGLLNSAQPWFYI